MREATRKLINELLSRMSKADLKEVTDLASSYYKKLVRVEADKWIEGQPVLARLNGDLVKCKIDTVNSRTCTVTTADGKKYRVPPSMIYRNK